jgi:SRSO17 transposase
VENCQLGVFLAYASPIEQALIDRELYCRSPGPLTGSAARRRVPAEVQFATKPVQATVMLTRALEAGLPAGWVTADEAYGQDSKFRTFLDQRRIGYGVAVPRSQSIGLGVGTARANTLAGQAPTEAWKRLSAGDCSKGPRLYDWAMASLPGFDDERGRWLLIAAASPTRTSWPSICVRARPTPPSTPSRALPGFAGDRGMLPAGQNRNRP